MTITNTHSLYAGSNYTNAGNAQALAEIPSGASRILDIGCGAGDNARILKARGCEVWGVTLSEREAVSAREHCHSVLIANIEEADLPVPLNYFDSILCSHVMEHLVRPDLALAKLAKHMSPGGRIIVAVPNMANWRLRVRLLRGDWSRQHSGPFDRTHLQFWSFATGHEMANGSGLQLIKKSCEPTAIPMAFARRVLPSRWTSFMDRRIGSVWPNLFGWQVILVLGLPQDRERAAS